MCCELNFNNNLSKRTLIKYKNELSFSYDSKIPKLDKNEGRRIGEDYIKKVHLIG